MPEQALAIGNSKTDAASRSNASAKERDGFEFDGNEEEEEEREGEEGDILPNFVSLFSQKERKNMFKYVQRRSSITWFFSQRENH